MLDEKLILVVDDDEYLLSAIGQTLGLSGYKADLQTSSIRGLEMVRQRSFDAIIADIRMPVLDGMGLLAEVAAYDPDLPVIIITGHGDISLAVRAMREGAYDFLEKPVDDDHLLSSLARAVEKRRLIEENRQLHMEMAEKSRQSFFRGMVGCHPLMLRLYDVVERVAKEPDPVLLCGETGTGKELVARAIHQIGSPEGPFVGVNMAAIPSEMVESELFGHERGAFTGALHPKAGKFEFGRYGTVFLDEICSLPMSLQAKLLRVLEEPSFSRLGSNIPIPFEVRIVSATNKNLKEEVAAGRFRQDLFYRLNLFTIEIPPLRKRKEDIPLLVEYFRQESNRERGEQIETFSQAQLDRIINQDWPGNIRELRNYVRRLCVLGEAIEKIESQPEQLEQTKYSGVKPQLLRDYLEQQEKKYLFHVLQQCDGKIGVAHQLLGLSRKGLYDKINKYSIDLSSLRDRQNQQQVSETGSQE